MTDCTNPECEAVRAELAELKRPRTPREYGLDVAFTATEAAIAAALLPAGRVVHAREIVAAVWPGDAEAGIVDPTHHSLCVHVSRMRTVLARAGSEWRIPQANGHGEYVLLGPNAPLPAGFREAGERWARVAPPRPPCPECGGYKTLDARRCIRCDRASRAAASLARGPIPSACPECGGDKKHTSLRCQACAKRRRAWAGFGACADCNTEISPDATRCVPCEQARRRREPQRRKFNYWLAS